MLNSVDAVGVSASCGFVTPLRYPGGKGRLGPWLAQLMRFNRISGGVYVEPYAGGAGAAMYLLSQGYVDHIVINDVDRSIYCFWWSILNESEKFISLVESTDVNIESWEKQRRIYGAQHLYDQVEIGFATFFLNRTNRSGILKGGVIGGKNQDGPFLLNARFNKSDLIKRIRIISSLRRHISLYNDDARDMFGTVVRSLPDKSLVYLDPPYFHKGGQLYSNHYKRDDHEEIANFVNKIKTPWLVSYDNCDEIRLMYKDNNAVELSLHYSTAKNRPLATEVMFYGNLVVPAPPVMTRKSY